MVEEALFPVLYSVRSTTIAHPPTKSTEGSYFFTLALSNSFLWIIHIYSYPSSEISLYFNYFVYWRELILRSSEIATIGAILNFGYPSSAFFGKIFVFHFILNVNWIQDLILLVGLKTLLVFNFGFVLYWTWVVVKKEKIEFVSCVLMVQWEKTWLSWSAEKPTSISSVSGNEELRVNLWEYQWSHTLCSSMVKVSFFFLF